MKSTDHGQVMSIGVPSYTSMKDEFIGWKDGFDPDIVKIYDEITGREALLVSSPRIPEKNIILPNFIWAFRLWSLGTLFDWATPKRSG